MNYIGDKARKALQTVTLGTLGTLNVEAEIALIATNGQIVFSTTQTLQVKTKAVLELPLTINNDEVVRYVGFKNDEIEKHSFCYSLLVLNSTLLRLFIL